MLRFFFFFNIYQVTFHNKCSKLPPTESCTYGHVWSRNLSSFLRCRNGCEWFVRHQKRIGEVSHHFQLTLNTLSVLSVPTGENLQDRSWSNVGAASRIRIDGNFFFLSLVWGNSLLICPSTLSPLCIFQSCNKGIILPSLSRNQHITTQFV